MSSAETRVIIHYGIPVPNNAFIIFIPVPYTGTGTELGERLSYVRLQAHFKK
jgi:hypothetical protein